MSAIESQRAAARSAGASRFVIYGLLLVFALIYILPLAVMVMTSLKPLAEVTGGNMFAAPHELTIEPWLSAYATLRGTRKSRLMRSPTAFTRCRKRVR